MFYVIKGVLNNGGCEISIRGFLSIVPYVAPVKVT